MRPRGFDPEEGTLSDTTADPTCMAAFWLIGLEDDGPQSSGELCV